jgi:hypothetical protein
MSHPGFSSLPFKGQKINFTAKAQRTPRELALHIEKKTITGR